MDLMSFLFATPGREDASKFSFTFNMFLCIFEWRSWKAPLRCSINGRREEGAVVGSSQRSRSQEEELVEGCVGLAWTSSTGLWERVGRGGREERRVGGILLTTGLCEERRSMREKKCESRADKVEKVAAADE